jgi:hypothetical protein
MRRAYAKSQPDSKRFAESVCCLENSTTLPARLHRRCIALQATTDGIIEGKLSAPRSSTRGAMHRYQPYQKPKPMLMKGRR